MRKYYSLYGRLLSLDALGEAFKKVRRSNGSAGIDNQSITEFGRDLNKELATLLSELKNKSYRPKPCKRVTIEKDDGGERNLGIPSVRDRVVQQAVQALLYPLFDPDFHPSSYGYRKNMGCHHAINKAQLFIQKHNRNWVVDMDLSKCFDRLDHSIIIDSVRKKVTDSSILNLLDLFLKSGVVVSGEYEETEIGSPQGGVISPLLSNIYLDSFDQFMKNRGHRIIRYADDILILCGSEKSAHNALGVAEGYLEGNLKLEINRKKTHIVESCDGVAFLGVKIFPKFTVIQTSKLKRFKKKVKAETGKIGGRNLATVIRSLNPILRGFVNYFRVANCTVKLRGLMGWIRRRLRAVQLRLWKKPAKLHRKLRSFGYRGEYKWMDMTSWHNSTSQMASVAMPNKWFHQELKLVDMTLVDTGYTAPIKG
ncbi:MAG: group II intron reverse transcriptase/maturase [Candidatus Brocadiaceae bacterium]|nr:group II intron reverse transcriptase/maturase [Candidatus Brocadiaceae bacterium]